MELVDFLDICENQTRLGTKIKVPEYLNEGKYPIVDQSRKYICGYKNEEDGLYKNVPFIIFGDVTRIFKYIDFPCYLGADGSVIIKVINDQFDTKYVYYALLNSYIPDTGFNRHYKFLKDIQIIKYPINKQKEIVGILDTIKAVIDKQNQMIALYDELIKARFVELFGDVKTNSKGLRTAKGSELFRFSSGKFLPEEKRLESGIPVYGGNGIAWFTEKSLVNNPTIIIGRVGAQCGNIHLVNEPVWITDNAIYIKEQKTELFTLEFLSEMMTVMDFSQYADYSGQPKITQKPLENIVYLIPTIEEQKQYSDFCKQLDKSKAVCQKKIELYQELLDKKMDEYFNPKEDEA